MQIIVRPIVESSIWYSIINSAMVKKIRSYIEQEGFNFNPYGVCAVNRQVNLKQHAVRFHVDVLMSSHVRRKVNDIFYERLIKFIVDMLEYNLRAYSCMILLG